MCDKLHDVQIFLYLEPPHPPPIENPKTNYPITFTFRHPFPDSLYCQGQIKNRIQQQHTLKIQTWVPNYSSFKVPLTQNMHGAYRYHYKNWSQNQVDVSTNLLKKRSHKNLKSHYSRIPIQEIQMGTPPFSVNNDGRLSCRTSI